MKMDQHNFYELCRLCLSKSEFKYSLLASNILEKVESLAPIEIKEGDELPTFCCETCFTNISNFYKFQQEILQSDKVLRDMLSKVESDPEVFELVKDSPELFEVLRVGVDQDDKLIKPKVEIIYTDDYSDYIKNEPRDDEIKFSIKKNIKPVNLSCDESSTDTTLSKCTRKKQMPKGEYHHTTLDDSKASLLDEEKDDLYADQMKKQNATLTCEKCNRKFATRRRFQRHMQGHQVEMCPVCCLVIRRDNLKKHVEMHGSPHEICDICGKIAKNRESLRGHIYYTHRDINKQIKCEHCDKEFKHNNHYQAHVRNVHLVIRNQQCHLCGKKFSNGYGLKKHINMTHHGSRPYVCQYCKKGFSSPYALKTHVRQHTLETPYPCEFCDQAFRQKVSLVTHLKSKHNITSMKKDEENKSTPPINMI